MRTPLSRLRVLPSLVVGVLVSGLLATGAAGPAGADEPSAPGTTAAGIYVVTLTDAPSASYDGGVGGLAATRPRPGERFDGSRAAVVAYAAYLVERQDRVLGAIGGPEVLYRYTTALSGFAVRLDTEQVTALRRNPDVALVERSTRQRLAAIPGSARKAGPRTAFVSPAGAAGAGRGTVIGFVDSGLSPDSPSFSALPQESVGRSPAAPGFHGSCTAGEGWSTSDCNEKVISARWFVDGFGADRLASSEHLSPRDATGHGSHVASVAAGNPGVNARIDGQAFGRVSGTAPAARIAVYKACWTAPDPDDDGCATADTVAAIDAAVSDGVDVLNYSASGSGDPTDTVSRAFLGAASAGVVVAAAAGNDGPHSGTVGHTAPWVTTVGANTRRVYEGRVVLGNGTSLDGAMVATRRAGPTPLVLSRDVAAADTSSRAAAQCQTDSLDAQLVDGTVVVCERGSNARVEKSAAVSRAGGVGMVLVNTAAGSIDADVHAVPTVHLPRGAGRTVIEYVERAGRRARVTLVPRGARVLDAPVVADFSGRGPAPALSGGVLKPDVTAPGVSVLGAALPSMSSGRDWDLASGTSTSTPVVAGLAAGLRAEHPRWSAATLKSALMTTATPLATGALTAGAGAVDARTARDPGIAFDVRPGDWARVLDGTLAPADLNQPSVSVGELVGRTTIERRITNLTGRTETYTADVSGLAGIETVVSPSEITLLPGQTRRITLLLAARSAERLNRFAQGTLTLTGGRHVVRVPMAVRPRAVAAADEVTGSTETGRAVVRGRAGTSAPLKVRSSGLVPADATDVRLLPGPFDTREPAADPDTLARKLTVPEGTDTLRVELDTSSSEDSLALYLYRGDTLVAGDGAATVTLSDPEPGDYTVYVNAASPEWSATGVLYTWVVGGGDDRGRQLKVPASVSGAPGGGFTYEARWRGLDPSKRWLAVLRYGDTDDTTVLQVD